MDLKDIYDHVRDNLHYYVKWRDRILAGYFATLVALAFMFRWLLDKDYKKWLSIPLFVAAGASVFFWFLDRRNREQYRACFRVGGAIEEEFVAKSGSGLVERIGLYHNLGAKSQKLSHSHALDAMYWVLAIVFVVAALYLCRGT